MPKSASTIQPLLKREIRLADLRALWPWGLLVLLVFAAYWPAISPATIWDDPDYLLNSQLVQHPEGLYHIWLSPSQTPHYFPVVFTSFWAEHRLWGMYLPAFHAMNLVYHALSVCLLWHLLRKLRVTGAWLAAALWAVHPMQVETVAWISERKNILGGLFFMLSVLAYLNVFDSAGGKRFAWYSGAIVAMLAAILSKQVMAVTPVVLIVIQFCRDPRRPLRHLLWGLPLFIPALLVAWIGIYQEQHGAGALGADFDFTWPERFGIAGRSLVFYVEKFFFPWPLLTIYPRFDPAGTVYVGGALLALFVLILMTLWFMRRRIGLGPCTLAVLYFIFLLPALGFISFYTQFFTFVADHYAYMALLTLCIAIAALIARLRAALGFSLSVLILAACVLIACHQSFLYRSELAMWQHTLRYNPSWIVLYNTGAVQARTIHAENPHATLADYQEPIALYQRAAALKPDWRIYSSLGYLYKEYNRMPEAIAAFERADELKNDMVRRLENTPMYRRLTYQQVLGDAYERRGDIDNAILWYQKALEVRPDAELCLLLGNCYRRKQDWPRALDAYARGTELNPGSADLWFYRGLSLRQLGRDEEGIQALMKARDLDPTVITRAMPGASPPKP